MSGRGPALYKHNYKKKEIRPQNITLKWHKNCFFLNGPESIQAGH
jgi:hypothetical protein